MTPEQIEAVAIRLAEKCGIRWKSVGEEARNLWRRDAQRAIEAVREVAHD